MTELGHPLAAWESFYVIVGTSGAALIGMQFIVMTLIAARHQRPPSDAVDAFSTPTVVHLGGALLISAVMSAPWPSLSSAAATLVIGGLAGLAYCGVVIRRARHQRDYKPVWQDWLWYAFWPSTTYAVLTIAGMALRTHAEESALFAIGGSSLALLFIGIHNAWDSVRHVVVELWEGEEPQGSAPGPIPPADEAQSDERKG
jgi:hypothetical protein